MRRNDTNGLIAVFATLLLSLIVAACSKGKGEGAAIPGAENVEPVKVAYNRLDVALTDGVASAADSCAGMSMLLEITKAPDPASLAESRATVMFGPEVKRVFPADKDDSTQKALDALSQRWTQQFADVFPFAEVDGVVLPYRQSIVLGDSVALIVLNHYLGADHEAYRGFPDYQRALKTPDRAILDLAEAAVASTHRPDSAETVLQNLLWQGALVEAVMRLTGADEATVLGYSPEEMRLAQQDEKLAYDALISRKMLFSTDPVVISRLIDPAPSTSILNPETPGRLGRFLGHRMVAAYLRKNADTPLSVLLSPTFYADPDAIAAYTAR